MPRLVQGIHVFNAARTRMARIKRAMTVCDNDAALDCFASLAMTKRKTQTGVEPNFVR